jgi:hypothetical protein
MQIKIKKEIKEGLIRLENKTIIREVMIKEDFLSPKSESIQICFSNDNSSGIIEISPNEFQKLKNSIEPLLGRFKLIK